MSEDGGSRCRRDQLAVHFQETSLEAKIEVGRERRGPRTMRAAEVLSATTSAAVKEKSAYRESMISNPQHTAW